MNDQETSVRTGVNKNNDTLWTICGAVGASVLFLFLCWTADNHRVAKERAEDDRSADQWIGWHLCAEKAEYAVQNILGRGLNPNELNELKKLQKRNPFLERTQHLVIDKIRVTKDCSWKTAEQMYFQLDSLNQEILLNEHRRLRELEERDR